MTRVKQTQPIEWDHNQLNLHDVLCTTAEILEADDDRYRSTGEVTDLCLASELMLLVSESGSLHSTLVYRILFPNFNTPSEVAEHLLSIIADEQIVTLLEVGAIND